jgi:hypothetical protein
LLAADRTLFPGLVTWRVAGVILAVSALLSFARSGLWSRLSPLGAAILADGRLDLKERVSSAVFLHETRNTDDGLRLLIETDAARSLERISIPDRFPIRLP